MRINKSYLHSSILEVPVIGEPVLLAAILCWSSYFHPFLTSTSCVRLLLSQVFLFFCESCSVPICRECSMGRHMGHTFVYLQDAVQDCRAITIQLLAEAQQGRQAVQVRPEFSR